MNMPQNKITKKTYHLLPQLILRYLICNDEKVDTLIMCKSSEMNLMATEQDIYEAMGCVKQYDNFKLNKLTKFFEVVSIRSTRKKILTDERVAELRKIALKTEDNQNND